MATPIQFPGEERSNAARRVVAEHEALGLRTYTPSQAVLARSAGVFHWTPEGRRLYDFTSGVLVSNLGHNPRRWFRRFAEYLGWSAASFGADDSDDGYFEAIPFTAYNAITEIETLAAAIGTLTDMGLEAGIAG
ncbi:MAG TPA: hypothetical protein EYP14_19280, partial [Planctomycetaceae bacterium]|nr:hypothetical protein [Planctomycetaceae bacterium]